MKIGSFYPPSPKYVEGLTLDDDLNVVSEVRAYLPFKEKEKERKERLKGTVLTTSCGEYQYKDNSGRTLVNTLYG
jgi:hypothetical protein